MNLAQSTTRKYFLPGLLLSLLILLIVSPYFISAYVLVLLSSIIMYIVMSVSWTIFSGSTGYISLASAAFFGVGVYVSAILGKTLPLFALILVGGLASFLLALLVGAITLRLRGIYFAIFTFGLVELIKHFLLWWEITFFSTRGRFVVSFDQKIVFYYLLLILVLVLIVSHVINRSKFGLALLSIGECEDAAMHIGINVTVVKVIAYAVSAFPVGAVGAAMATNWTYIDPYIAFNPIISFMPVLMSIFGGMGNLFGPVIGATVFAYLEELLVTRFPYQYMLIFGIIMVVAVLYLPNGLIGLVQKLFKRNSGGETCTYFKPMD